MTLENLKDMNSSLEIFRLPNGKTEIAVRLESETVWLSQKQMSELFDKDADTIGLHLKNIFSSNELDEESTTEDFSVVQIEGKRKVNRKIKHYNLDAIISVGYRVNSSRGIQFRKWASNILKEYLIQGYSINERLLQQKVEQLQELQKSVKLLGNIIQQKVLTNDESSGLLRIMSDYAYALDILDQYDYQTLAIGSTSGREIYQIGYDEAIAQIQLVKEKYGNSDLFGKEKDESFQSSISTIYQTFEGVDLYPSIEEKAANLLYLITKNHSFIDGNKRIAAFLFLYFMEKNHILYDETGRKRIADNALVALTLMIAVSNTEEKDTITKVIVSLINKNN
jgi:prophage maintenance system killer protein